MPYRTNRLALANSRSLRLQGCSERVQFLPLGSSEQEPFGGCTISLKKLAHHAVGSNPTVTVTNQRGDEVLKGKATVYRAGQSSPSE